jgi:hypothetical protein
VARWLRFLGFSLKQPDFVPVASLKPATLLKLAVEAGGLLVVVLQQCVGAGGPILRICSVVSACAALAALSLASTSFLAISSPLCGVDLLG